jgi:hypothetical protein
MSRKLQKQSSSSQPEQQQLNRDALIQLCERAIVPHDKWRNRDTPEAQQQLGRLWMFLKSGCEFVITEHSDRTVKLSVKYRDFDFFEGSSSVLETDYFYLPTEQRLDKVKGEDWH